MLCRNKYEKKKPFSRRNHRNVSPWSSTASQLTVAASFILSMIYSFRAKDLAHNSNFRSRTCIAATSALARTLVRRDIRCDRWHASKWPTRQPHTKSSKFDSVVVENSATTIKMIQSLRVHWVHPSSQPKHCEHWPVIVQSARAVLFR